MDAAAVLLGCPRPVPDRVEADHQELGRPVILHPVLLGLRLPHGYGIRTGGPLQRPLLGILALLLLVVVVGVGGVFGLALLAVALVEGVLGAREGEAHALAAAALAGLAAALGGDDGGDARGDGVLAAAHPLPAHLPALPRQRVVALGHPARLLRPSQHTTAGPRRRTRAKT